MKSRAAAAARKGPRAAPRRAALALAPLAVCASVAARTPERMEAAVDGAIRAGADLAEARLDLIASARDVPRALDVLSAGARGRRRMRRTVCTLRPRGEGGAFGGAERERIGLLGLAAEHGPRLLDVEYATLARSARLRARIESAGADVVASWHDRSGTPPLAALARRLERMSALAPYVKIVTTAARPADPARVLSLYGMVRGSAAGEGGGRRGGARTRLVAFAMGEMGRVSRVLCLYLGSPYTYASLGGAALAPGQLDLSAVRALTGGRGPAARA